MFIAEHNLPIHETTCKQGVKDLITEYFKIEILDVEPLTDEMRENIIATFTYAYNNHHL